MAKPLRYDNLPSNEQQALDEHVQRLKGIHRKKSGQTDGHLKWEASLQEVIDDIFDIVGERLLESTRRLSISMGGASFARERYGDAFSGFCERLIERCHTFSTSRDRDDEEKVLFDDGEHLCKYLFVGVANAVRDERGRWARRNAFKEIDGDMKATSGDLLERELDSKECTERLKEVLKELPPTYRQAWIRSKVVGWTYKQIAAYMGMTVDQIGYRVNIVQLELETNERLEGCRPGDLLADRSESEDHDGEEEKDENGTDGDESDLDEDSKGTE